MMIKRGLSIALRPRRIVIVAALVLAGCAASPPPVTMPAVPQEQIDTADIAIDVSEASNLKDNVVQIPYRNIQQQSTVVIAMPDHLPEYLTGLKGDRITRANGRYLLEVEQELEKELIRLGFRLINRSLLEKKLEQLNEARGCADKAYWWRCQPALDKQVVSILDGLEAQYRAGKLSAEDYAARQQQIRAQIDAARGKGGGASQVKAALLPAVLEAARSETIASDYVLYVEYLDATKLRKRVINLASNPEVRRFATQYPQGIRKELQDRRYVNCTGLAAEMTARLVDAKSGEVVWLGEHRVSQFSGKKDPYLVQLGVRRYPANEEEIRAFVEAQTGKSSRNKTAPKMPAWRYDMALLGPTLIKGQCDVAQYNREEIINMQSALAKQVAKELVKTIRVGGGPAAASPRQTAW